MAHLVTDAVVLHAFDYLETSRILRLATREGGVQSVLARGARRSVKRFGSALDLFAGGVAEIHVRPGRELHTLASFDVTRARARLAADLDRFTAASAIAELVLRFAQEEAHPALFDALVESLDAIGDAPPGMAREGALAAAWRLVAHLGFSPTIDECCSCHARLAPDQPARFSHAGGGVVCENCTRLVRSDRTLPADARALLRGWLGGDSGALLDEGAGRAHVRLLREFLQQHLTEGGRPLRAYEIWERDSWGRLLVPGGGERDP
jgi:DNA repair protein RecO (recombination protein O)